MLKNQERKRLSGEDRSAAIIDTALTLFAEKGFAATRTHEIAEAAGISGTLIFQHFKTKNDLIRAALVTLFHSHPLSYELKTYLERVNDDAGFFRTVALHFVKRSQEDPRIMKLIIYTSLEDRRFGELTGSDELGPSMLTLITEYIQKRMAEGAFVQTNPEIAARLFVEAVFMYIADQSAAVTGPPLPFSSDEVVETLVAIFLGGLQKK